LFYQKIKIKIKIKENGERGKSKGSIGAGGSRQDWGVRAAALPPPCHDVSCGVDFSRPTLRERP
jgi:hypothetical protein